MPSEAERYGGLPTRRLEGRDGEIVYDWAVRGMSQPAIGQKHGLSQQRISEILAAARKETETVTREEERTALRQRIAAYRRSLAELVDMKGAPVTAGKDGQVVLDPEGGEVVRDYGTRVAALGQMVRLDERLAKLLGLDDPVKVKSDVTVTGLAEASSALAEQAAADLNEGD